MNPKEAADTANISMTKKLSSTLPQPSEAKDTPDAAMLKATSAT